MLKVNQALIFTALKYYGLREDTRPGKSNPAILTWLQSLLSVGDLVYDRKSNYFENVPQLGDVVVFWRESPQSWKRNFNVGREYPFTKYQALYEALDIP